MDVTTASIDQSGHKIVRKNSIKFGVLLGLSLVIIKLVEIYLKNFITVELHYVFMLLQIAAYVFFIYTAIRFAKQSCYKELFVFANGVKTALWIGLFGGLLFAIYNVIEQIYIIPNTEIIKQFIQQIQQEMTEDISEIKPTITIVFRSAQAIWCFCEVFLISLLVSFFISPFFKDRTTTM
jgi:cation transport ATPase